MHIKYQVNQCFLSFKYPIDSSHQNRWFNCRFLSLRKNLSGSKYFREKLFTKDEAAVLNIYPYLTCSIAPLYIYLNSTWTLHIPHIPLHELYLNSRQMNIYLYLSIYSGSATLSPASTLPLHLCTLHRSISFTSILALSHLSLNSARPLQPPVAPSPWQVGTWIQNWGCNIWEEKSKEDHLIVKVHSAKKEIQWGYDWIGLDMMRHWIWEKVGKYYNPSSYYCYCCSSQAYSILWLHYHSVVQSSVFVKSQFLIFSLQQMMIVVSYDTMCQMSDDTMRIV